MKKKILFCSEASWYATGYSVYTKEILSRLSQIEDFEVAELGCYAETTDVKGKSLPWKFYGNKPNPNSPEFQSYKASPTAQFGDQSFNHVLLDFKPDIVMDIRDWWMIEYQQRSPFRDFFHWSIMPTVDAEPQADQWINTYASADSVFAYSEFGRDTMLNQCDDINFVDIASPAASHHFAPAPDKRQHKANMGISPDSTIIGTVMRNQRRKLYPDLMESFRKFLDEVQDPNCFLYCHTYYPDVGWDLPKLIYENGLSSRLLMTYKCKKCGHVSVDFFKDAVGICDKCKSFSNAIVGISNPIDEKELSKIYNCFDIYVQYANSEGFGMPQLEAAGCGLPVISTNYSAMESVVKNIGGYGVIPKQYYVECETGCKRAIPDNEAFVNLLKDLHKNKDSLQEIGNTVRENALENYSWDKAADAWAKHFKTVEPKDPAKTWYSPLNAPEPSTKMLENPRSIAHSVNYIFTNVLHKPEWIGGYLWKRVLRDVTFGYRCENMDKQFYFNESHKKTQNSNSPFSLEDAYNEMINFRKQLNNWEHARVQRAQQEMQAK
jgi:glycosyltransferase involved in cell wall biosynthesis